MIKRGFVIRLYSRYCRKQGISACIRNIEVNEFEYYFIHRALQKLLAEYEQDLFRIREDGDYLALEKTYMRDRDTVKNLLDRIKLLK